MIVEKKNYMETKTYWFLTCNSSRYDIHTLFKENGVWIDLYKIKKCCAADVRMLIAQEAIDYLDRRLAAGGLSQEEYNTRIRDGRLIEKIDEAKKWRAEEINNSAYVSRDVYIIWSASKVVLEENWIEPLRIVSFEGLDVTTFGMAEEYLKKHYGDSYNELPPDEMRRVGLTKIEW